MSLNQNLRILRKSHGLSQEDFADKLDVSRQAVSKWESGEAYPETEKIIAICDLFNCNMDNLVRGEIQTENHPQENPLAPENYDKIMTRAVRGETLSLAIILLGISLALTIGSLLQNQNESDIVGSIIIIISIILAIPILTLSKTKVQNFREHNPVLDKIYPDEISAQQKVKYTKLFSFGIATILLGVIALMLLLVNNTLSENLSVAVLMYFITIGESLLFYASKMSAKYNLEKIQQPKYARISRQSPISPKNQWYSFHRRYNHFRTLGCSRRFLGQKLGHLSNCVISVRGCKYNLGAYQTFKINTGITLTYSKYILLL